MGRVTTFRRAMYLGVSLLSSIVFAGDSQIDQAAKHFICEWMETTYRLENDGSGETMQTARISVLTQLGRNAVAQMPFPYRDQLEELRIDYFRTVKKDGKQIDADPASAIEVAVPSIGAAPIFNGVRVKTMVAPQLEAGDQLEFRSASVIRVPLKPRDFWASHDLGRVIPMKTERVVLDVPEGRKLAFKANPDFPYTVVRENHRIKYRWEVDWRKQSTEDDHSKRRLFIASTLKDWSEVGLWYDKLQAGRTTITPQIAELAASVTQGKSLPEEKVDAIYTYVAQKIRYVAIEVGIGGYQAHAASDVLRNGYGDCKDKVGLMVTLLAAAGLKGYPAAVRARPDGIDLSVPMPGQFNHVIVAVPLDNRLLWADPTQELAPIGLLPSGLRGQSALLIEPGHVRLETIPERSPISQQLRLESKGELDAAGRLKLHNWLEVRGEDEVAFRQMFRLSNEDSRKGFFHEFADRQASGASVEDVKSSDPTNLHLPFSMQYRLIRPSFFEPLESSVVAVVPASIWMPERAWARQLQKFEKNPGLKEELKLEERDIEERLELQLNPEFHLEVPSGAHFDRSFASYDSSYSYHQNQLKVRRKLTVKTPRVPADRRAELSDLQKLIDGDLAQKLLIHRSLQFDIRSQIENLSATELSRAGVKALERDKDFELALDLLVKAVEKDPRHNQAWNNLGRVYMRLNKNDLAERALKKQIEINPKDAYSYNNLGLVYLSRNQYPAAIDQFKKQLEINPLDSYAIPNLADAYDRSEGWREAAEAWQKALEIAPDQPRYSMRLANALIQLGRFDAARVHLRRALEKDPSALMENNAAYALADGAVGLDWAEQLAKSAVEQAASTFKKVVVAYETNQAAATPAVLSAYLDTLGWVYFQKGQLKESRAYLEASYALRLSPVAAEHLARLNAREGDAQGALQRYSCARRMRPNPTPMPKELGEVLRKKFGNDLDKRMERASSTCFSSRQIGRTASERLTFPQGATIKSSEDAVVAVLVGEGGTVEKVDPIAGEEPFISSALADAGLLRFAPVSWPGGTALKTLRTIHFRYLPDRRVYAGWDFGRERRVLFIE